MGKLKWSLTSEPTPGIFVTIQEDDIGGGYKFETHAFRNGKILQNFGYLTHFYKNDQEIIDREATRVARELENFASEYGNPNLRHRIYESALEHQRNAKIEPYWSYRDGFSDAIRMVNNLLNNSDRDPKNEVL